MARRGEISKAIQGALAPWGWRLPQAGEQAFLAGAGAGVAWGNEALQGRGSVVYDALLPGNAPDWGRPLGIKGTEVPDGTFELTAGRPAHVESVLESFQDSGRDGAQLCARPDPSGAGFLVYLAWPGRAFRLSGGVVGEALQGRGRRADLHGHTLPLQIRRVTRPSGGVRVEARRIEYTALEWVGRNAHPSTRTEEFRVTNGKELHEFLLREIPQIRVI